MSAKPGSPELAVSLERCLSRHFGRRRHIRRLSSRPWQRASSFRLEELEVEFECGEAMRLMTKELSGRGMLPEAFGAKPSFLSDPMREIEAYQILSAANLGTPLCYGWDSSPDSSVQRLFLERIDGRELYEVGEYRLWEAAARWLAQFHCHFSDSLPSGRHLLRYDAGFYRQWIKRADNFVRASGGLSEGRLADWDRLSDSYGKVVQRLEALGKAFIHGEFYASNVLIRQDPAEPRICPVDWEMAAIGPGLIDLAALISGKWSAKQRNRLAEAYWRQVPGKASSLQAFLEDLEHCRLHLAVQWLGWSPAWTPPAEHRQDWLGEGLKIFKSLGY